MPFTEEEKITAKQYAYQKAEFMFMPTPELRNKIAKDYPMTKGIVDPLKGFILEGKPIHISAEMIIKYCDGSLDVDNTWLLDQGHIKVIPQQYTLSDKGGKL